MATRRPIGGALERDAHRGGEPAIRLGALGAWWQRYFTENAAVWLLRRWNAIEWRRAIDTRTQTLGRELDRSSNEGRLRAREGTLGAAGAAGAHLADPAALLAGGRQATAVVLYGLALLTLLAYALGLIGFLAALRDRAFALTLMLFPLFFVPFGYSTLLFLLQREHAQGTSVFLRLARLDGWDLLYGAYTAYALAGATRIYLLWGAPFLLVIATVVYDSLLAAIGFCVRVGLCYLGWSLLFQTLVGLLVAPRPTLLWQVVSYTAVVLVGIGSTVRRRVVRGTAGEWRIHASVGKRVAACVGDALRVLALAAVSADWRDDGAVDYASAVGRFARACGEWAGAAAGAVGSASPATRVGRP
jgi:hypothetical protein